LQNRRVIPVEDSFQFKTRLGVIPEFAPSCGGVQIMAVRRRQFAHGSDAGLFPVWQKASDNAIPTGMNVTGKLPTLLFVLWALAPAKPGQTTRASPVKTLAELRTRIAEHLAQPRFAAAAWGVKIVSLETGATLFQTNAAKLLKPARTQSCSPARSHLTGSSPGYLTSAAGERLAFSIIQHIAFRCLHRSQSMCES